MSSAIHLQSTVVVSSEQVSCDLAGETAILHTESGIYFGLNELGTHIWGLIQTPQKVSDLRDALLWEYEVEKDLCESDLLGLLGALEAAHLIVAGE